MERILEIFNDCLVQNRPITHTTAALTRMRLEEDDDDDQTPPPPPAFDIGRTYDGDHSTYTPTRVRRPTHDRPMISLRRCVKPLLSTVKTSVSDHQTETFSSMRQPPVGCKEAAYGVLAAAATNNNNPDGRHYAVLGVPVPPCGCRPAHADVKARYETLCTVLGTDKTGSLAVADALELVNQAFDVITDMEANSS